MGGNDHFGICAHNGTLGRGICIHLPPPKFPKNQTNFKVLNTNWAPNAVSRSNWTAEMSLLHPQNHLGALRKTPQAHPSQDEEKSVLQREVTVVRC